MSPLARRKIGKTDLNVTQLGFGGGTLGDPNEITSEAQAETTLATAFDAGIGFYDTAPWYGNTKSEHRVGHFLRQKPRESFLLSTKVGRVYSAPQDLEQFQQSPWAKRWVGGLPFDLRFDYTQEGIWRSYQDSLNRLGINRVNALVIHDLDLRHQKNEEGVSKAFSQLDSGGGFSTLRDLKQQGAIQAIGAGINHIGMIPRFLAHFDIDYFLVAMPYTLLNQEALDDELPLCVQKGVGVVIGAVFASGILATGPKEGALHRYQPAEAEILEKVKKIETICQQFGIPLPAAALQFPLYHSAVASVIPGANSPEQVQQNLEHFQRDIPSELWDALKQAGLLHPDAPTP